MLGFDPYSQFGPPPPDAARFVRAFETADQNELLQTGLALQAAEIPFAIEAELMSGGVLMSGNSQVWVTVAPEYVAEARSEIESFLGRPL